MAHNGEYQCTVIIVHVIYLDRNNKISCSLDLGHLLMVQMKESVDHSSKVVNLIIRSMTEQNYFQMNQAN